MLALREIRDIYQQGLSAVAAAFKQLYEMIEVEDERVQKLIRVAAAAHLRKIEQLEGRVARLEAELSDKARQVCRLNRQIKDLSKQLRESQAETRLAKEAHLAHVLKSSHNSSRPPSADPRKRTRSLRQRSGRKPGGQVGHPGATLGFVDHPERLIIHTPQTCDRCGSSLSGSEVAGRERRQVHDLPPQRLEITEHQAETRVCGRCGRKNKAEFPAGVNAPVQYGAGVRAVAAYLMGYQLLPYERCAEAMDDLFQCHLSAGTVATLFQECSGEVVEPLMLVQEGLRKSAVIGVDETSLRVSQRQDWVHVSSTDRLTLLVHNRSRGAPALESIGILAQFKGVAVHDGFSAYERYRQCGHGLCNVHTLRDLNYVIETSKPAWAQEMKALLLEIKAAVGLAREAGKKRLPRRQKERFLRQYDRIVAQAGKLYGPLKRKKGPAKTRKKKESPLRAAARKLVNRLGEKKEQILLFMNDFRVPFDNNQAERDLRMLKVKAKISGCFRTERGAAEFCRLRSYVSTMKKQGEGVMEAIRSVFAGERIMPLTS